MVNKYGLNEAVVKKLLELGTLIF
ncbi:hypothetical protein CCACVL1_27402 [Corchorus capsularis]|uniref:Uncharacterized protein n=1 Tax=Corchorus capsularis TaxID=210143 RepID=A0A1R3GAF2_COCAP|nr:hypothetical protein CCACVL1_27402 [Corchorus capsularis]